MVKVLFEAHVSYNWSVWWKEHRAVTIQPDGVYRHPVPADEGFPLPAPKIVWHGRAGIDDRPAANLKAEVDLPPGTLIRAGAVSEKSKRRQDEFRVESPLLVVEEGATWKAHDGDGYHTYVEVRIVNARPLTLQEAKKLASWEEDVVECVFRVHGVYELATAGWTVWPGVIVYGNPKVVEPCGSPQRLPRPAGDPMEARFELPPGTLIRASATAKDEKGEVTIRSPILVVEEGETWRGRDTLKNGWVEIEISGARPLTMQEAEELYAKLKLREALEFIERIRRLGMENYMGQPYPDQPVCCPRCGRQDRLVWACGDCARFDEDPKGRGPRVLKGVCVACTEELGTPVEFTPFEPEECPDSYRHGEGAWMTVSQDYGWLAVRCYRCFEPICVCHRPFNKEMLY